MYSTLDSNFFLPWYCSGYFMGVSNLEKLNNTNLRYINDVQNIMEFVAKIPERNFGQYCIKELYLTVYYQDLV